MRTSKYTPEQITSALQQAENGTTVVYLCRKMQVTDTTFYRWRKKFGGLGTPEIRKLQQLRDENRKLKQLVAGLSFDKSILPESLRDNGEPGAAVHLGDVTCSSSAKAGP